MTLIGKLSIYIIYIYYPRLCHSHQDHDEDTVLELPAKDHVVWWKVSLGDLPGELTSLFETLRTWKTQELTIPKLAIWGLQTSHKWVDDSYHFLRTSHDEMLMHRSLQMDRMNR